MYTLQVQRGGQLSPVRKLDTALGHAVKAANRLQKAVIVTDEDGRHVATIGPRRKRALAS